THRVVFRIDKIQDSVLSQRGFLLNLVQTIQQLCILGCDSPAESVYGFNDRHRRIVVSKRLRSTGGQSQGLWPECACGVRGLSLATVCVGLKRSEPCVEIINGGCAYARR